MANKKETWKDYVEKELELLQPILQAHGYGLNQDQPHTAGERYLMQNLTTGGGKKIILLGERLANETKVVIKATRDDWGAEEIKHERHCRQVLHDINFAYERFHSPVELDFLEIKGFTISVQEFIEQSSPFLERPLKEQFTYALNALKKQERARATTKSHYKLISKVFGTRNKADYQNLLGSFLSYVENNYEEKDVLATLEQVREIMDSEQETIEQYCGFLTHTDFVPHNFRINDGTLYLLDFSSLLFGNKHESWARFLNFMTLYNSELENLLIKYVEDNKSPEERRSLQLMRLYRLTELITYYVKTLESSDGKLRELNEARIGFWHNVLQAELKDTRVDRSVVEAYKTRRDALRSEGEKKRQIGLH